MAGESMKLGGRTVGADEGTGELMMWRLLRSTAIAAGLIAAVFWVALGTILALGFLGVFSVAIIPPAFVVMGLFLVFTFLWQMFALVRIGLTLERLRAAWTAKEPGPGESSERPE